MHVPMHIEKVSVISIPTLEIEVLTLQNIPYAGHHDLGHSCDCLKIGCFDLQGVKSGSIRS